jgi:hypothetical protein
MSRHTGKVFGIGLSRTGTHSLTKALNVLGYNVTHYPTCAGTLDALQEGLVDFPCVVNGDGMTDITTIPYITELDRRYPNSKFILTVRHDEEEWLESVKRHWNKERQYKDRVLAIRDHLRLKVYGQIEFDKEHFLSVYKTHTARMVEYFSGRGDLLIMDITSGDGYAQLASFLGCIVPARPFPHIARSAHRPKPDSVATTSPPPQCTEAISTI